ncbi:hypothetical protein LSH36_256g03021 [Paralvinella palmiformis]|uniref:Uncharacterized protein n=1 Tax=Paralvinella palmiformis TaxID=53620 RepID=A0AAD9N4L0_9ANNE|nr:hypothetical protein LSH36_256g03021 [Paralvinella palmiformis]
MSPMCHNVIYTQSPINGDNEMMRRQDELRCDLANQVIVHRFSCHGRRVPGLVLDRDIPVRVNIGLGVLCQYYSDVGSIVERANDWLTKNTDLTVKECETITWMDHDVTRLDDSEQMILRKRMEEHAKTYHIRGLRAQIVTLHGEGYTTRDTAAKWRWSKTAVHNAIIKFHADGTFRDREWLGNSPAMNPVENLWTIMEDKAADEQLSSANKLRRAIKEVWDTEITQLWLLPQRRTQVQCICYTDILPDVSDTVPSLVTKVNRIIQQNQLIGQIITVQTVSVPISNGNVDTELTRWTESVSDDIPYAFCLRIFHDKSSPGNGSSLGIRDFIPCLTDEGYESFDQLSIHANTWLKDQADIILANMQSVMVQKDTGPHDETGRACFYSTPGIENLHTLEFLRILRVCYLKPAVDVVSELPVIYPFTYELFSPELVPPREGRGRNRMERMRETFIRVNSYLKSSGADIISVETVMNPMQLYLEDISELSPDEIQFLFTIRLFLTDQLAEPDELLQTLSLRTSSVGSRRPKEPSPADHPGPIFLKSVVNKNYKSRWIVVAVTVFTCMTIIVVISVIYSNP